MRWRGRRQSGNIEDHRRAGGARPGGLPIPVGRGGMGIGGLVLLVVLALALGIDPLQLLQGLPADPSTEQSETAAPSEDTPEMAELKQFVAVVLADTEDTWHGLFEQLGTRYEEPTLVLFSGSTNSACGFAGAAVGPFYCPADKNVYIDLTFYNDLRDRFGAPGDFAQAYVIAHEVGHHVQNLLGISEKVMRTRRQVSDVEGNALSVRLELQADCFAGLWAHHADRMRGLIEAGDIDEALNAASAIGDDTLQRRTRGSVSPDSFTHGSAAQRVHWFRTGFDAGSLAACDTFARDAL